MDTTVKVKSDDFFYGYSKEAKNLRVVILLSCDMDKTKLEDLFQQTNVCRSDQFQLIRMLGYTKLSAEMNMIN